MHIELLGNEEARKAKCVQTAYTQDGSCVSWWAILWNKCEYLSSERETQKKYFTDKGLLQNASVLRGKQAIISTK